MCVFLCGNNLSALNYLREEVARLLCNAAPEKERLFFLVLLGLKNSITEHDCHVSKFEKKGCTDTAHYPLAQCKKGAVNLCALPQHAREWAAAVQIQSAATTKLRGVISNLEARHLDCRFVFLCEPAAPWQQQDGRAAHCRNSRSHFRAASCKRPRVSGLPSERQTNALNADLIVCIAIPRKLIQTL